MLKISMTVFKKVFYAHYGTQKDQKKLKDPLILINVLAFDSLQ